MRRLFGYAALTWLACSGAALAGQSCGQQIAATEAVLTGMFMRDADQVTEINGFPLLGSSQALVYANCPVVAIDGAEATACGAGILERQGELLLPIAQFGLEGCTGGDMPAADCPDFTAEGFGANNGQRLAEVLRRSQNQLCSRLGEVPVAALSPVAGTGDGVLGLEGDSFFEIMPDCAGLGAGCAAAMAAAPGDAVGVTRINTGAEDRLACAVDAQGALLACATAD